MSDTNTSVSVLNSSIDSLRIKFIVILSTSGPFTSKKLLPLHSLVLWASAEDSHCYDVERDLMSPQIKDSSAGRTTSIDSVSKIASKLGGPRIIFYLPLEFIEEFSGPSCLEVKTDTNQEQMEDAAI